MALEFDFTVNDPEGMHARPASLLVKKAQEYQSDVSLAVGDKTADAKRIFGVMGLGVAQGDVVKVTIQGSDEAQAEEGLRAFFKENL